MLGGERKVNKIRKIYSTDVHIVSYLRRYYSGVPNFLAFGTPHEGLFLMFGVPNAKYLAFGVPNAKYLAFGTPDESALSSFLKYAKIKINTRQIH